MANTTLPLKMETCNKNWLALNLSQTSTWICYGPCWIIAIIRNKIMAWHKSIKLHVIEFEIGMIGDRTEAELYSPCITFPLQDMDYSAQSDFILLIILLTLISHFDFLKSNFLDLVMQVIFQFRFSVVLYCYSHYHSTFSLIIFTPWETL